MLVVVIVVVVEAVDVVVVAWNCLLGRLSSPIENIHVHCQMCMATCNFVEQSCKILYFAILRCPGIMIPSPSLQRPSIL